MTYVLGIDPGSSDTAYTHIDADSRFPLEMGKLPNQEMRDRLNAGFWSHVDHVAIEMIASYGMAVGAEVFDTCVWIGRYIEVAPVAAELVYRRHVKVHHCNSARATDANIRHALIDRFAHGDATGKGTKAAPGWFYGFKADIWQAYAIAVYIADRNAGYTP